MARALLKKSLEDEVIVVTPSGPVNWFIVGVRYE
jgi:transcription elongation GreA/GreB family factor